MRRKDRQMYNASVGYDVCICVHAEQNAPVTAAAFWQRYRRRGRLFDAATMLDCTKAILQAKARAINYLHECLHPIAELRAVPACAEQAPRRSEADFRS